MVLEHDKYHDKKKRRTGTEIIRKRPIKFNKKKDKKLIEKDKKIIEAKLIKQKLDYEKDMQYKRRKLWNFIVKKDIPKVCIICFGLALIITGYKRYCTILIMS